MNNLSVAMIFFNRPEKFQQTFNRVRQAKPSKLFLIQDGPRNDNDKKKIEECRKITEQVDWECEVFKNFSDVNLGCGVRPYSGITWAFEHTDRLIILEDDCCPDMTFFDFASNMLEKYKDDQRVGIVSGYNYFGKYDFGGYDYGFVKSGAIWGWATWKDRWDKYDYFAKSIKNEYIEKSLELDVAVKRQYSLERIKTWHQAYSDANTKEKISYWDYQWGLCRHINSYLAVVPAGNLINNIGVTGGATHESDVYLLPKDLRKVVTAEINPYKKNKEPDFVLANRQYDNDYYAIVYPAPIKLFKNRVLKLFKIIYKKLLYLFGK